MGVRVPQTLYEIITTESDKLNMSVSQFIYRVLLAYFLENSAAAREEYKSELIRTEFKTFAKPVEDFADFIELHALHNFSSVAYDKDELIRVFIRAIITKDFTEWEKRFTDLIEK